MEFVMHPRDLSEWMSGGDCVKFLHGASVPAFKNAAATAPAHRASCRSCSSRYSEFRVVFCLLWAWNRREFVCIWTASQCSVCHSCYPATVLRSRMTCSNPNTAVPKRRACVAGHARLGLLNCCSQLQYKAQTTQG